MKRRNKTTTVISQMNVVPYIDVMLVLLIIFMVTAPMFVPGVINLPSVGKASQVSQEPIQINITKEGGYSVTQSSKSYPANNLNELITKVQSLTTDGTPVVVSADKDIKYDQVISVVDKLYSSGIKKVALVVKERNN
jgi:biopolymer transport protein TolR